MAVLLRVLQSTAVTISHTFTVDETLMDAGGAVTATVKRLDGTAVASGAATHVSQGLYSFPLPQAANLDTWTVDWAGSFGGVNAVVRDYVEIVGGFLFGLPDVRTEMSIPKSGANAVDSAKMAAKRVEVEQTCERICGRAWVPRFHRFLLNGSGGSSLIVPDLYVRAVRAVSVADSYGQPMTPLDAGSLAAVAPLDEGVLFRDDGSIWPQGHRNVLVEYEYGADYPPAEISSNAMLHFRNIVNRPKSGVPDRAQSFTVADGGVYRLTMPGADSTGIPDVDAAYARQGEPRVWISR